MVDIDVPFASDDEAPTAEQIERLCRLLSSGDISRGRLEIFLNSISSSSARHANPLDVLYKRISAQSILGDDIIFPEDVMRARGLQYSEEQCSMLLDTLPSEYILQWCKKNNYALVPGPPQPMNLMQVRDLKRDLFVGNWDSDYVGEFAYNEFVDCCWLAMRKDIVPDSTNLTWRQQQDLLYAFETVPTVVQLVWFTTTYSQVHSQYYGLLKYTAARTKSTAGSASHEYIEAVTSSIFVGRRVLLETAQRNQRYTHVGLASMLDLDYMMTGHPR